MELAVSFRSACLEHHTIYYAHDVVVSRDSVKVQDTFALSHKDVRHISKLVARWATRTLTG